MAPIIAEAVRRRLTDAWMRVRPYWLAAAAAAIAAVAVIVAGVSLPWALLVAGLVANSTQWWLRDQRHRTRIDKLQAQLAELAAEHIQTVGERDAARRAWKVAESEVERLAAAEVVDTLHKRMEGQS